MSPAGGELSLVLRLWTSGSLTGTVDGTEDRDSGEADLGVEGAEVWGELSLRGSSLRGSSIHLVLL